jgi:hypothetical protein
LCGLATQHSEGLFGRTGHARAHLPLSKTKNVMEWIFFESMLEKNTVGEEQAAKIHVPVL